MRGGVPEGAGGEPGGGPGEVAGGTPGGTGGGSGGGPREVAGGVAGGVPGGPPAAVESDRDPGLQPERTRLAWRRTTLSCAATTVLALRQVLRRADGGPVAALAVCLAAFAFLLFLRLANRRIQDLSAPGGRPPAMSSRAAVAAAGCTVALAVFGAALVR